MSLCVPPVLSAPHVALCGCSIASFKRDRDRSFGRHCGIQVQVHDCGRRHTHTHTQRKRARARGPPSAHPIDPPPSGKGHRPRRFSSLLPPSALAPLPRHSLMRSLMGQSSKLPSGRYLRPSARTPYKSYCLFYKRYIISFQYLLTLPARAHANAYSVAFIQP